MENTKVSFSHNYCTRTRLVHVAAQQSNMKCDATNAPVLFDIAICTEYWSSSREPRAEPPLHDYCRTDCEPEMSVMVSQH